MIKNIVFDMGNVLLRYSPSDYLSSICSNEDEKKAVGSALFFSDEWLLCDKGEITVDELIKLGIEKLPQYSEKIEFAARGWYHSMTDIEGMTELVEKLKADGKYKLFLLSNTNLQFWLYSKDHRVFSFMDGLYISAEHKLLKPDRAIFESFLKEFSLKAEECVFIDDYEPNVNSARQLGFTAFQFHSCQKLAPLLESLE